MTRVLYDNIVNVVAHYLGPAAPRFVDRQISSHLNKEPQEVTSEDLVQLTDWIRVSLALLTNDIEVIDECVNKLNKLHG